jgi:hypothetical protein
MSLPRFVIPFLLAFHAQRAKEDDQAPSVGAAPSQAGDSEEVNDESEQPAPATAPAVQGTTPDPAIDFDDSKFALVEQVPWEENIHWGDDDEYGPATSKPLGKLSESDAIIENKSLFAFPNDELESGSWVNDIIWDPDTVWLMFMLLILTDTDACSPSSPYHRQE